MNRCPLSTSVNSQSSSSSLVAPSLRPPIGSEIRAKIQPTFSIALTFGSSQSAVLGTSGSPFELDLDPLQKKHFMLDLSELASLLVIRHSPLSQRLDA